MSHLILSFPGLAHCRALAHAATDAKSAVPAVQLEPKYLSAKPLDAILADVKYLQDLLTLATTAPTVPLEITLWREDITRDFKPGEHRPQAMNYYALQFAERVRLDAPQSPGHVLFQFDAIGGLATIARWVKVAREYHTVLGSLL